MSFLLSNAALEGRIAEAGEIERIGDLDFASRLMQFEEIANWRYSFAKRVLDLAIALPLSVALFVPCLLIAFLVRVTSQGGAFYSEERIGRNGKPFRIKKFRSMYTAAEMASREGADDGAHHHLFWRMRKHEADPRITPIGRFLRNWSIDELPQLVNVIRGEMSLVGPRPIVKCEMQYYGQYLPYYLAAMPGLSGLWQVSGRCNVEYDERVRLDASYVMDWKLREDFRILFRTIPAVLLRIGAK